MQVPKFHGCGGLARYLEVTESRVRQLDIPPDATVDGRKAWTEQTAERLKAERIARQRKQRTVE
jgi:hypothetical protein